MNSNPQRIPTKEKDPDFLNVAPQGRKKSFLDVAPLRQGYEGQAPPGQSSQPPSPRGSDSVPSFLDVAPLQRRVADPLQDLQPQLPEQGFATAVAQSTNVYGKGFAELSKPEQQRKAFNLGVKRYRGQISDEEYLSELGKLDMIGPDTGQELVKGIGRGVVNLPRYAAEIGAAFHPNPMSRMAFKKVADELKEVTSSEALRMNEQVKAASAEDLIANPALIPAWLAAHGGESLPTMAPGVTGLKLLGPASKAAQLGVLFLGSAPIEVGAQLSDLRETVEAEDRFATPGEKALAVASGLLAAGVEAVGEGYLYGKLAKALSRSNLDEATQEAIKQEFGKSLTRRIIDASKSFAKGGSGESATEMVQNTISQVGAKFGWDPDRSIWEGLPESGITGFAVGGPVRAASDASANQIQRQQFNQLRKQAEELGISEEQLMEMIGESAPDSGSEGTGKPQKIVQPVEFSYDDTASPQEQVEQLSREEQRIFEEGQRVAAAGQDVRDYDNALDAIERLKEELGAGGMEHGAGSPTHKASETELTEEAREFLVAFNATGVHPPSVTGKLRRMAEENGIEVTEETAPEDIVRGLQEKAGEQRQAQEVAPTNIIGAVIELPGGERYVGATHSEAVRKAMEEGHEDAADVANTDLFLQEDGSVVSRDEAMNTEQAESIANNRAVAPKEAVRQLREAGIVSENEIAGRLTEEGLGSLAEPRSRRVEAGTGSEGSASTIQKSEPITLNVLKNPERAPNMGSEFGQDIEPAGDYVTEQEGDHVPEGWKQAQVTLKTPLIIDVTEDTLIDYKKDLSEQYGGLKGKDLSQALREDGYDSIITRLPDGTTSEIVLLENQREAGAQSEPFVTGDKSYQVKVSEAGELQLLDNETGEPVSRSSKHFNPAMAQYLSENEEALAPRLEPLSAENQQEYLRRVAQESENPVELIEAYEDARNLKNIEQEAEGTNVLQQFFEEGGQIRQSDITRLMGSDFLPGNQILYTRTSKSALPLDVQAQELSGLAGYEITPEDIIEYTLESLRGGSEFKALQDRIKDRFKDVTGINLTDNLAEEVTNRRAEFVDEEGNTHGEALMLINDYLDEDGNINYNKLWEERLSEDQDKTFFTVFPGDLTEEQYQEFKNEVRQQAQGQRPAPEGETDPSGTQEAHRPEEVSGQIQEEISSTPSAASRFSSTGGYSEDIAQSGTNPAATLDQVEIEVVDGGTNRTVTLGQLDEIHAVEMPELVKLVREVTGTVPTVSTRMKTARGIFYPIGNGKIRLKKEIFQNPVVATKVLAHEIGHLIDYLPEGTMSRGNLLGRIKSLRKYLKTTAEGSESTGKPLTTKDRRQLRSRAKKAVIEESGATLSEYIDNQELQEQLRSAIKERYREYVEQEIADRGLLSNKQIFEELYAHSKQWRPFNEEEASDKFIQYRRSSEELYADALSALLVSPGTLEQNAPTFYNEFFAQLDQKPDVKKTYLETQAWLNGGEEAVLALRDEEIGMMAVKAEEKMQELVEERKDSRRAIDDIMQRFIDRFHPILKDAKNAVKAGKMSKSDYNSLQYLIEEMQFRNNDVALFVHDIGEQVLNKVEQVGMTNVDLHSYLLLNRIANERLEINEDSEEQQEFKEKTNDALKEESEAWGRAVLANPRGLTAEVAQKQLDFMKKKLGAINFGILEQSSRRFQELNFEVAEQANRVGLISDEIFNNIIKPNKYNYATFRVIDYIEYPDWMSAAIQEQKGTFKDVSNTFDATMLKSISQLKLVRINAAKNKLRDMWTEMFPEEFSRAKQTSPGRWKKVADREHLFIYEDGKRVAYDADPYLTKAFDFMDPAMSNALLRLVGWTNNSIYRPLFITYNPSFFAYSNVIRDVKRLYKNVPQSSIRKIISGYITSWSDARDYAKGKIDNPRVRQLIEDAAIVPPSEAWVLGNREDSFARQAKKYHLSNDKNWAEKLGEKYSAFEFLPKFLGWLREAGTTMEILPKLAADRILDGVEDVSRQEKAYIIRNRVGTPNWKKGGTSKKTMNTMFMFSNIMVRGYEADIEVATDPKTRGAFWFRTAMIDILPKVLMSAAMAGLFGDELKEFYGKVTEYDKTNYIPIPMGWQEGGATGREAVYLRIPQDETGRLISATMYKLLETLRADNEQDYSQIFDLYSDELPTLSPALNTGIKWVEFLGGGNPMDDWRDRPILPSRVQKARRVNSIPALKKMVEWSINQTGITNYATFNEDSKTWNEFILQTTPLLNSAIKISDYGAIESKWDEVALEEARKSNIRLSYGDEVLDIVSQAYYLRRLGDKRTQEQTRKYMLSNGFYQQVYLRIDEALRQAKKQGNEELAEELKTIMQEQANMFKQMIEEPDEETN